MSFSQIVTQLYLPLLTQETAIMVSTFTYGLKAGASTLLLVAVNTAAVITDLILFFLPTHVFARRLHALLSSTLQERYDTGTHLVERFGTFRAATAMGFVMPSIAAMLVAGVLRLSFWPALAGLFVGSVVYVVIPLIVAEPLAPIIPRSLLPLLPWLGPILAVSFVIVYLLRLAWQRYMLKP